MARSGGGQGDARRAAEGARPVAQRLGGQLRVAEHHEAPCPDAHAVGIAMLGAPLLQALVEVRVLDLVGVADHGQACRAGQVGDARGGCGKGVHGKLREGRPAYGQGRLQTSEQCT